MQGRTIEVLFSMYTTEEKQRLQTYLLAAVRFLAADVCEQSLLARAHSHSSAFSCCVGKRHSNRNNSLCCVCCVSM